MKKTSLFSVFLAVLCMISLVLPTIDVSAATFSVNDLDLEVSINEDTITLTKDTPSTDSSWTDAGIVDISKQKNEMKNMNVSMLFFDKATGSKVQLMSKDSEESREILNLSLLSEEERQKFYESLKNNGDDTTQISVEPYNNNSEVPFFRYTISARDIESGPKSEVLYGTIMNGRLISFDMYSSGDIDTIDESYIQSLVDSTHFTYVMSKEEYDQLQRETKLQLIKIAVIIVAAIIIFIVVQIQKKKQKKARIQLKTERMQAYYKKQKEKQENNIPDKLLFTNKTTINESVIKNFYTFTVYKSKSISWAISALLVFLIIWFLSMTTNGLIKVIIALILVLVFVYSQGVKIEKSVAQVMKRYDKKNGTVIKTTFYEDHLCVYQNGSPTHYAYIQLSDLKFNKDFVYLYYTADQAICIDMNGFETSGDDFVTFIKNVFSETPNK